MVKMMSYNSEMMRNLMMDLLDHAQMENNSFKVNNEYFNLHEIINKAFGVVGHVASNKKVSLQC